MALPGGFFSFKFSRTQIQYAIMAVCSVFHANSAFVIWFQFVRDSNYGVALYVVFCPLFLWSRYSERPHDEHPSA